VFAAGFEDEAACDAVGGEGAEALRAVMESLFEMAKVLGNFTLRNTGLLRDFAGRELLAAQQLGDALPDRHERARLARVRQATFQLVIAHSRTTLRAYYGVAAFDDRGDSVGALGTIGIDLR
jgi:hypothetical protein